MALRQSGGSMVMVNDLGDSDHILSLFDDFTCMLYVFGCKPDSIMVLLVSGSCIHLPSSILY